MTNDSNDNDAVILHGDHSRRRQNKGEYSSEYLHRQQTSCNKKVRLLCGHRSNPNCSYQETTQTHSPTQTPPPPPPLPSPPPYGSLEYWETRYRTQFRKLLNDGNHRVDKTGVNVNRNHPASATPSITSSYSSLSPPPPPLSSSATPLTDTITTSLLSCAKLPLTQNFSSSDDNNDGVEEQVVHLTPKQHSLSLSDATLSADTLPFHEWYFSYEELRVIMLPLILGGRKEAFGILAGDDDGDCDAADADDDDNTEKEEEENGDEIEEKKKEEEEEEKIVDQNGKDHNDDDGLIKSNSQEALSVVIEAEDDDGFETCKEESDNDDSVSDDEADADLERVGLAKHGPISCLEIGCGDVPLCCGLIKELIEISEVTGVEHSTIVNQFVATDYSTVVIDAMKQTYGAIEKLRFETVDARQLPYSDSSFELVVEKGVLDAMLADVDDGQEFCIQIVRECARVLSINGILVLISHLNATTPNGMRWMEEVIFKGLSEHKSIASWEIEVHGSDGRGIDAYMNDTDPSESISPGPAVYIVHKRKIQHSPHIPLDRVALRFFVY